MGLGGEGAGGRDQEVAGDRHQVGQQEGGDHVEKAEGRLWLKKEA